MNIETLITQMAAAVTTRTLYPASHPRVIEAVAQIVTTLENQTVTFLIVGDDLVVDQNVLRKATLSQRHFVVMLQRKGIERLTLGQGLTAEELQEFVAALATGTAPESSDHIILGKVEVAVEGEEQDGDRHALSADQLDLIREAFARFRSDKRLPLGEMEQMVWGFIESMSRSTRAVLPLAKLKEHDEYTFVHSVNVSLLVLAQARSFGIEGALLHSFGMAALLHDIGKLMVPLDVLNRPGKLEGEAWTVMQSHAEQGSWYLAELEGAIPLSILVAYEHHLRYDGKPAYPVLRVPRIPTLASRMTSIADAYDAMSTVRPYQQPLMRTSAIDILRNRAETFYDPLLVANFAQLVQGI
jgi:HD-GYP domain-containing protein (c-di-GMP phosphodiesterase class II)